MLFVQQLYFIYLYIGNLFYWVCNCFFNDGSESLKKNTFILKLFIFHLKNNPIQSQKLLSHWNTPYNHESHNLFSHFPISVWDLSLYW